MSLKQLNELVQQGKLVLPDYKNCIANLPNSVLKKFGLETLGSSLPLADQYMAKKYKNIVVLLLDGMGTHILEKHLAKDPRFCLPLFPQQLLPSPACNLVSTVGWVGIVTTRKLTRT